MPVIDLGGAPAWEDCAQLGRTPDFDRLNRLELACYEAALRARHGPPPEGCAYRRRVSPHDFGTYRTLALVADDRLSRAGHRYVEAAGAGLARWIEAGFGAPAEYLDGAAVRVRSFDTVILGALQLTRPNPDDQYPLGDFAVLHAKLAAAHPRLAAKFRRLTSGDKA